MEIGLLRSRDFDIKNYPLIVSEINKRGYKLLEFCDFDLSSDLSELLSVDVLLDRSSITSDDFFNNLIVLKNGMNSNNMEVPIFVNEPLSIMNSYDKIRTQEILESFMPPSKICTSQNIDEVIDFFSDEEFLVVKEPRGWQGKGTDLCKRTELPDIIDNRQKIVQKRITSSSGVGRALCINTGIDFEIISVYSRQPVNSWRTGTGSRSEIFQMEVDDNLYNFIKDVSYKSKLYINGIDFIRNSEGIYLLEINSVPRLVTAHDYFKINPAKILFDYIEKSYDQLRLLK